MSQLIEVEQYPVAMSDSLAAPTDQSSGRRETNLLQLAWRARWLVLLCMALGGGVAWLVLQRVTPRFTSVSRVYVQRNLPQFLSNESQVSQSNAYLFTQAELMKSTPVLSAAADSPDTAQLECFRDVDNKAGFLKKNVQVVVGNQDEIINVLAELPSGKDAAAIVNAVVNSYIAVYAERKRTNTVEMLNILRNEKERRDAELEERRQALNEFRSQHPALAVSVDKENVITRQFSTLATELNKTEIDLLEAKARYTRVKELSEDPEQRMSLLETASGTQRTMRDMDLESRVQQVELTLTGERARWGEGHPRVKLLRESVDDLKEKLKKQQQAIIESYVDSLRREYELMGHKRDELRISYDKQYKQATDVNSQAIQLASLEEAYNRTEKFCDILDGRIKEMNMSEEVGAMNVSIMETAAPSSMASFPDKKQFFAAGILAGGLVGFGLAWLRDLLDHRLRSAEEIASVLQLSVLGALPYFGDKQESSQAGRLIAEFPRSTAAESIRTLRTALHFGLGAESKIIVVTSPSPSDGKSTVASNLAIALAQADQKVLLIDADLRKPTQHRIFEVSKDRGLSTVLADRRPFEEVVIPNVYEGLSFLPSGLPPANPVELLNNGFFADFLNKLRDKYDRVVIDSPPVMPVADARVIAALGDATILVLRAERTTRRIALAARNELWRVRANRLGVVVNGVPMRKQGYGHEYGYYSEYGYSSYAYGNEDGEEHADEIRALPAK